MLEEPAKNPFAIDCELYFGLVSIRSFIQLLVACRSTPSTPLPNALANAHILTPRTYRASLVPFQHSPQQANLDQQLVKGASCHLRPVLVLRVPLGTHRRVFVL